MLYGLLIRQLGRRHGGIHAGVSALEAFKQDLTRLNVAGRAMAVIRKLTKLQPEPQSGCQIFISNPLNRVADSFG